MRSSPPRIAVWLCALLQLVLANGSVGFVLCIEPDGEVALEVRRSGDSCHSPADRSDCESMSAREGEDCCSDTPVVQRAATEDGAGLGTAIDCPAHAFRPPLDVAAAPPGAGTGDADRADRARLTTRRALRSVVLLV